MDSCFNNAINKEWLTLRRLRLLQVRNQTKAVNQEVLRRTRERQALRKAKLQARREKIFEQVKREKIKELEEKYQEAVEKFGWALRAAKAEPEYEKITEERRLKNCEKAQQRGNVALRRQAEVTRKVWEKENAPIRRKEMTRRIEDIRSGLVVQCRDINVIEQAGRQVLLDIPVTNVQEFQPLQPRQALRFSDRSNIASNQTLPKRKGKKDPKSPTTPVVKMKASPSPGTPPVVPKLAVNLEELRSSGGERTAGEAIDAKRTEPAVDFYDHNARYARTYRLANQLVNKFRSSIQSQNDVIHVDTFVEDVSTTSSDEELNIILRRYQQPQTSVDADSPVGETSKLGLTPPTHEDDFTTHQRHPRKKKQETSLSGGKKSKKNETLKWLKAIDESIEEGRRLKKDVCNRRRRSILTRRTSNTETETEDESDTEAVVKLVVNVNCGQTSSVEKTKEEFKVVDEKACQIQQEKKNIGTEIGQSFIHKTETSGSEGKPSKVRRRIKRFRPIQCCNDMRLRRICCCNMNVQYGDPETHQGCLCKAYDECNQQKMQRSSTLQDLRKGMTTPEPVDLSSIIHDDVMDGVHQSPVAAPCNKSSSAAVSSAQSQSGWSSTAYFTPPHNNSSEVPTRSTAFKLNPELDFYIRKLLEMPPHPCDSSSECTECRCRVSRSSSSSAFPCNRSGSTTGEETAQIPQFINPEVQELSCGQSQPSSRPISSFDQSKNTETGHHLQGSIKPNYKAETEQRLHRIAEYKLMLERLHKVPCSTSSGNVSSVEIGNTATSTSYSSSSSNDKKHSNDPTKAEPKPPCDLKREDALDLGAHRLSTIIEVDSRLQASDSVASGIDVMGELMRRNILSAPFTWSEGESLPYFHSDCSSEETNKEQQSTKNMTQKPNLENMSLDWSSLDQSHTLEANKDQLESSSLPVLHESSSLLASRSQLAQILKDMDKLWAKRS